jgi:periplasmic protein TonB
MFDAIGVSERTRKPWTVAVSFAGQMVMIGLAVVVPLVSTEGLPHMRWVSIPEPPRALTHRPAPAAMKRSSVVPSQVYKRMLVIPTSIPAKAVILQDPQVMPSTGEGVGVVGGFDGPGGPGGGVINTLVASLPAPVAPPAPTVAREPAKEVKRIVVGGKVQAGRLLSGPQPVYPPLARAARVEGVVHLRAIISGTARLLI